MLKLTTDKHEASRGFSATAELLVVVSDKSVTERACYDRAGFNWIGCKSAEYGKHWADVCVCDTDFCNGAVMTSSFGHVIVAVALAINLIIGYLL